MKYPWSNLQGFPQMIVICVCIFLVAGGLCGVQVAIANIPNIATWVMAPIVALGYAEVLAMLGSLVVLVFCLVAWPISVVMRRGKKGDDE